MTKELKKIDKEIMEQKDREKDNTEFQSNVKILFESLNHSLESITEGLKHTNERVDSLIMELNGQVEATTAPSSPQPTLPQQAGMINGKSQMSNVSAESLQNGITVLQQLLQIFSQGQQQKMDPRVLRFESMVFSFFENMSSQFISTVGTSVGKRVIAQPDTINNSGVHDFQ